MHLEWLPSRFFCSAFFAGFCLTSMLAADAAADVDLKLEQGVTITLPDDFEYRARVATGEIVHSPGRAKVIVGNSPDVMEMGRPILNFLLSATTHVESTGLRGHVGIIFRKQVVDVAAVRQRLVANPDAFVAAKEAPDLDPTKDQFAKRISLTVREVNGFPAIDHAIIRFDPRDTFKTRPTYARTLWVYRPEGIVLLSVSYTAKMPADAEGTPRRWTPEDGAPLEGAPIADTLDAVVQSLGVAAN